MWNKLALQDACSLISRGISPKYLESGGVRVLNQKCIRSHTIDYSLARRHDISIKGVKPERFIQKGDVLVNSTGQGTLGRVAQVRNNPDEPTTVDSHVTIVRPKPEFFCLDYFGFAAIFIENELKAAGQGTSGQTELSKTKLKEEFSVSFPLDFAEQQRIVAKLDAAFAELDTAKLAIQRAKENHAALKTAILAQELTPPAESEAA
jgi:type I restriction enzyme S subunit